MPNQNSPLHQLNQQQYHLFEFLRQRHGYDQDTAISHYFVDLAKIGYFCQLKLNPPDIELIRQFILQYCNMEQWMVFANLDSNILDSYVYAIYDWINRS